VKIRGFVYYNGRELEPPFIFTGQDSDTLYLNDIPYAPVRKSINNIGEPYVPTELRQKQNDLSKLAWARSKHGKTSSERLELLAETFLSSVLVDSVKYTGCNSINVYWKDSPIFKYEGFEISTEELPSDSKMVDLRKERFKDHEGYFWRVYNKGGIVAFGEYGYIFSPAIQTAKNRELINRLASGDSLTAEEVKDSILHNNNFYKLVIERLHSDKIE